MRFARSMILWLAAPLGATLLGCGGDVPTEPTDPPLPATAITVVSGDGQVGKAGEDLPHPFVIRSTPGARVSRAPA